MASGPIQFVRTRDGVRIAYAVAGRGPVLLHTPNTFVSSFIADRMMPERRRWSAALEAEFTVVQFDFRGHGLSQREVDFSGFDDFLLDLEAVANTIDPGYTLLGYLGSAPLALRFLASFQNRAERLITWHADTRPGEFDELHDELIRRSWGNYTELYAHGALGWDNDAAARRLAAAIRASISVDTALELRRAMSDRGRFDEFRQSLLSAAAEVKLPVLLMHRELRHSTEIVSSISAALETCTVKTFPGRHTTPYMGKVAQVVETMRKFVGGPSHESAASGALISGLTPREREVLSLVARGKSNREIAEALVLSTRTVEQHLSHVYFTLGLSGKSARAAAAALVGRSGDPHHLYT